MHAFGRVTGYGDRGWSGNKTKCGKSFKHHDREKNRRTDKAATCLICAFELTDIGEK